jgi:DNA-binding transcriptional ArsR family regulator
MIKICIFKKKVLCKSHINYYNTTIERIFNCLFGEAISMDPKILDEHTAVHVAELFRAFSDTSRVRILSGLVEQEINISALAKLVGVTESAVSHHMRGLRMMQLVKSRREGKEVFYSVIDPHIIALFQQGVRHVQED